MATKNAVNTVNTVVNPADAMKELIRQQIMSELETNAAEVNQLRERRDAIKAHMADLEKQIQDLKFLLSSAAIDLKQVNAQLMPFEQIDAEIERRFELMNAALLGVKKVSSAKPRTPKAASPSIIDGHTVTMAFDGTPRSFDLGKLTARIKEKIGRSVSMAEFRQAWQDQNGYAFLSEDHVGRTGTVDIDGLMITVTVD